jgi:hypothetical protein
VEDEGSDESSIEETQRNKEQGIAHGSDVKESKGRAHLKKQKTKE